jgi:signal transduction histidine kinase
MSTPPDQSTGALAAVAEATRLLYAERPFAQRISGLFALLKISLRFRDCRLTCWLQSAQPGATRRQFFSDPPWAYPWDDVLTRSVALGAQTVRKAIVLNARPQQELPMIQAEYLGLPITWGGRLWGIFECRAESQRLDPGAATVVQALAPLLAAGIAEEGDRLTVPALRRSGETPTGAQPVLRAQLAALNEQLDRSLDPYELLQTVLRRAIDGSGATAGAVALVDSEAGDLVLQLSEGYPQRSGVPAILPAQRWKWEHGLAGRAVRNGQALMMREQINEPGLPPLPTAAAEIAAPILVDGRAAAVVMLHSTAGRAFADEALTFVRSLCERAGPPLGRARAVQESRETAFHLSQVFAGLPTGIALLDLNGRVLRHNPAWLTTWGLPGAGQRSAFHVTIDLAELLLSRLVEPLQLSEFIELGRNRPEDVLETSLKLRHPGQELQIVSLPTHDSRRQLTGRLWMVTDRTREREADRMKTEFVSIVSHELRTPLTSILGYTELLLNRKLDPSEQRSFIETVYSEASRLEALVQDMLNVSRLEAGAVKLNRWMLSLRQLAGELAAQLYTQLQRHKLMIDAREPLPPVHADRDKVKQILTNLLGNAIKYSPQGGEIRLTIRPAVAGDLPPHHPPGRWMLIAVRDHGIGIAEDDLPRIFERFHRVDNTNTRRIGGTGLGLHITRLLVELHGGRVWATSKVGKGSLFCFTLPIAEVRAQLNARTQLPGLPE